MVPAAGPKGVGAALFVELMAACLTGATPGYSAAPFSGTVGGPPRTGQFFIAIDPGATSLGNYGERVRGIASQFADIEGARLPGRRRLANRAAADRDGVRIPAGTIQRVNAIEALSMEGDHNG
jgi:(2R)-3-sulfolactate dehydrogenase (NADP+)